MWRPCAAIDDTYEKDLAIVRTPLQWGLMIAGLGAIFLLPLLVSGVVLNTINYICITIIALQGANILIGMTGLITLGQAAFMAVGAYTMALMVQHLGLSIWLAMPIAVLVTGLSGVVVGLPSLRIKGFYLGMATLAAQFIIPWLIVNVRPDLTGGTDTLTIAAPRIGTLRLSSQSNIFYLCMPVCIFITFFVRNIQRSRFGRAFIAIRDNVQAAEIMGIAVVRYKLLSFFLCSLCAGLAGVLYAVWMRGISVDHFPLGESIWYLGMLIVGGMGSVPGAVFGAILIRSLNILVRYIGPGLGTLFPPAHRIAIESGTGPVLFGLFVLLFLIFEPRGLVRIWDRFKAFYRLWPFPY